MTECDTLNQLIERRKTMYRNKLFYIVFALVICLSLTITSFTATRADAKDITISCLSAWPKNTFMVENFTRFIDRVNAKAAKQYPGFKIHYKGGPEVISFKEQIEAVRSGLIDMVFTAASYYTSVIPAVDGLSASALHPWEEREKGVYDFLQNVHKEKANTYYLSRLGSGIPFQIYVNKPIKTLDDLKGMKLRCSPTLIPFLKKIGVNPVMMKPGDIYTALERGVVEGYVWPAAQIAEWGWEKITKYVVEPPIPYGAIDIVLVNLDTWNKLPKDIQGFLDEAAKEDEFRTIVRAMEYIPRENARLKKMGIEYIQLSEADTAKMNEAAITSLWDTIIGRDPETSKKLRSMISK